jgi:hypothetical protein
MWPGDTHLLALSQPYEGHDHVVVCLQGEVYGDESCAKVFLTDETGQYTGGPEFRHAARFDYGTLQAVCKQLGYDLKT